jgi:hypothetical protein
MKDVNLSSEQIRALENLWFQFGNRGAKHTDGNHKFIQVLLEQGIDRRVLYNPTADCVKAVEAIITTTTKEQRGMRDGEVKNGLAWFCFDLQELEWLYDLVPQGDEFRGSIMAAIRELERQGGGTAMTNITTPAAHIGTNPDGTCSDSTCPCQQWSKQEPVLTQTEYETARDEVLARVHAAMAEDCDCPLHRLSPEERTARIDSAVDQTNAMIVNGDFAPNFETAWLTAPPEYSRYTEENHALYWYLRGMADEQRLRKMTAVTVSEDVAEMGRLVKEGEGR